MMYQVVGIIYWIGVVRAQTGANCDVPCENYLTELKTANELWSQNVNNIGGDFANPSATLQAVCEISGDDIQTCFVCSTDGQGLSDDSLAVALLDAWWETCATYQKQGISGAYNCWLSIPTGSGQCEYLASDPNTPQSSMSDTVIPQTATPPNTFSTSMQSSPSRTSTPSSVASQVSMSTSSTSQISSSTISISQISSTPTTSPTANAGHDQHVTWKNSNIGSVIGMMIDLLL